MIISDEIYIYIPPQAARAKEKRSDFRKIYYENAMFKNILLKNHCFCVNIRFFEFLLINFRKPIDKRKNCDKIATICSIGQFTLEKRRNTMKKTTAMMSMMMCMRMRMCSFSASFSDNSQLAE